MLYNDDDDHAVAAAAADDDDYDDDIGFFLLLQFYDEIDNKHRILFDGFMSFLCGFKLMFLCREVSNCTSLGLWDIFIRA